MTKVIAFHYHRPVTGAEVKRIRQALGLTQQQFADRLGVHKVTVAKWETDAQGIRGPAARLIALLGQGVKAAAGGKSKPQPRRLRAARTRQRPRERKG